ncbi:MAG: ATP-binding protein [Pyramidobacter sp.]|nr:ATP-binding protein [Pyramidobacter sp.]
MKLIKRTAYLDELKSVAGTPDIKVITGVRRSGKSKLLESFIASVQADDDRANVIHVNFNLTDHEALLEYHSLERYIEERYEPGMNNYVMIDEIQMCPSFEKAVNSLHAREKYDIYVTGSNAFLQSSDLATLFVGRTFETHVFPFSFREYCDYFQPQNPNAALTQYMTDGGMAGSYLFRTEAQKARYIGQEVLDALIVRDIENKYKIRNEPLLNRLIDFLMDAVGSPVTANSIAKTLNSAGTNVDHKTVAKYIDYLCKAFAFYRVRKYDIRGKRYLRSEDKYYLCDHSFKYARLGTKNMDYGHVLENIVAVDLLRRGSEVYAGSLYGKEVDFVSIARGEKEYIQVAWDVTEPKTFAREVAPLLSIKDAYPKTVIARTFQPPYQHEGIKVIDAADWLMGKK